MGAQSHVLIPYGFGCARGDSGTFAKASRVALHRGLRNGHLPSYRSPGGSMAHLFGLIFLALAWLSPVPAQATITATSVSVWRTYGFAETDNGTPTGSCQAFAAMGVAGPGTNNDWVFVRVQNVTSTTSQCVIKNTVYPGWGDVVYNQSVVATQQQCPANSTFSGGVCTCNSGYVEDGSQTACVTVPPPNNCASLLGKSAGTYSGPKTGASLLGPKQVCVTTGVSSGDAALPGCLATGEAAFGYESTMVGSLGVMYWQAQFAYTGAKCNPDPSGSTDASGATPAPAPAPGPSTSETTACPVGKVPGEVNGKTICVTPGTDTPQQRKNDTGTTEQKADGTTVEKTTSKQAVCDATKCTTTTTTTTKTTPPGGTASTTTEASTSTCVVGSPECTANAGVGGGGGGGGAGGDDASFGGSCTAAFNCKGDAIMCAVALEQHKRDCALFVDSSPESDLYASEKTKTGAQYSSENVTISNSSFNSSNAFGGSAQCIQDKAITVWGSPIVLPFSQVCDTLAHLGTVLMSVSFLLAFRIVARG